MKEIQKKVTTLKTIYVSKDGREFDDVSKCREWENNCCNRAIAILEQIPHIVTNSSVLHMYNGDEEDEVWLMIPSSPHDIEAIRNFENCFWSSSLTHDSIGKPLAIRLGAEHDYCVVYDLSEHIQDVVADITRAINAVQLMNKERRGESNG
nr:MAG TPA: hypothetical protein [Caudoviricetes sp.]